MPSFNYIAMNKNKNTVKGRVDALDLQSARAEIRKKGLTPVKITEDTNFAAREKKGSCQKKCFA